MEVSLSKVPPQLRQNVAEAERPGTTLMYTFGDRMYYWAKPKAMKEWHGPEHASMVKAGKGKLFKQAVAEGEEEWAKQVFGSFLVRQTDKTEQWRRVGRALLRRRRDASTLSCGRFFCS